MRDESIFVPRHDGGIVHVTLTREDSGNPGTLIAYVPGLGGDAYHALAHLAGHYFPQHGMAVARIDPVTGFEGGRSLADSKLTIQDQAKDIATVIAYLQKTKGVGLDVVHGIAHSLSVYQLIIATTLETPFSSIVLWEGSDPNELGFRESFGFEAAPLEATHYWPKDTGLIIAESYVRSLESFDLATYAASWQTPSLLVAAENSPIRQAAEEYERHLQPARKVVIPDADHYFLADPEWTAALLMVTTTWLQDGWHTI